MNPETPSPDRFDIARRRAGARLGFYIHLSAYIVVMLLLTVINFAVTPGYKWFVWPLLGWGVGLIGHGAGIFVFPGMLQKMTEQELQKIGRDGE